MKNINQSIEVFLSLIKWFGLFVLLNNAIWLAVFYTVFGLSGAEMSQMQDGTNNVQEMTHG